MQKGFLFFRKGGNRIEYFINGNGKIKDLIMEEYKILNTKDVNEISKELSIEKLKALKKWYEKFSKPLMEHTIFRGDGESK